MKQALYFLAGALLGLGGGYLLGKRKKTKTSGQVVTKTINDTDESKDDEHDSDETEVEDVLVQAKYIVKDDEYDENYDEEDLQDDIEEIDDYICRVDHPEDDDEPAPKAFERIDDDDFYTSKNEFDKIRLVLDCSERTLMDGLGSDVTDLFARNGISLDQLYFESNRGQDLVYYRCWRLDSDYEISVEGCDSE